MYIIRDSWEDTLNLPKGQYEIPLILTDRILNTDGSLNYPVQGSVPAGVPPVWIPEFFGDVVLVNGKVFPYLDVEPRKYRFRMLNASNVRFYHLQLQESAKDGRLLNRPGPSFRQIGSDGGLLPLPVSLSDLLIAPAERFDLVIDFSGWKGRYLVMTNDAPAPFPGGGEVVPQVVMQFRVASSGGPDTSFVPLLLNLPNLVDQRAAVKTRDLVLAEADHPVTGDPIIGTLDNLRWDDPPTETPKAGTIEIWRLINTTGDWHPKHVHLVQFQILDRQPFDVDQYNNSGQLVFTGPMELPLPNEIAARKDVVKAPAGYVTRIIAKFDLPTGTAVVPNHRYRYIWHCHILEHEDNEMMRPYDVVG
jgi:spore coat protein A